jgi:probable phosphoglycerate mutase
VVAGRTTCILVRHGHVEGIHPPRFRGRTELPLTPLGERQAQALRNRIAMEWDPDAVYSSPLGRCLRTAGTVAEPFDLTVKSVDELIDFDYGQWQGLTYDEVHAGWPEAWARWRNTPHLATIPEGESLTSLVGRSVRALHEILNHHRGQTVVVVAHNSINRALLLHALDLPLQRYWAIRQAPCTLNVLEHSGGVLRVRTFNETGHLLGL